MGEVIDFTQDRDTVMDTLEKNRIPQVVIRGTMEATFEELKRAVMQFCNTHCETTRVGALKCPNWSERCPLYPFRMGAVEAK